MEPNDVDALALVYETLAKYARLKAIAMQSRLKGFPVSAWRHEDECDRLYLTLPEWAKW
jgi:hypothetical protein